MGMLKSVRSAIWLAVVVTFAGVLGCNGFGTSNVTAPGGTPPVGSQLVYRVVGSLGTPFIATVSDARSSWTLNGVVPLNIVIVNAPSPGGGASGATRMVATKLANDSTLLSIEIINGFGVALVNSTFAHFGSVVGGINGKLQALAPPASPDVRYAIIGPANAIFNAVIEDESTSFALQSRVPTIILQDSPNGGSSSGRVDGIFTLVQDIGPFNIDLFFNGTLVAHAGGGGTQSVKFH
jgi:hypothetical protein